MKRLFKFIADLMPFGFIRRSEFLCMHRRIQRQGIRGALDTAIAHGLVAESIIDVGAELGTPSIWERFPEANLLLVEPRIECHDSLQRYAVEYQKRGVRVSISDVAVGDKGGFANFEIAAFGGASSLLGPADRTLATETKRVRVTTIDDLVSEYSVLGPILLKIDVEGYDLRALMGAEVTLEKCSAVLVEATPQPRQDGACKMSEILNFMESRNWVLSDILASHYTEDRLLDHCDLLFLPQSSTSR